MKLSVCMITYNHEKFIEEAVMSALRQKTSFPFEIVIGEDGSSDNTRQICETLQQKYPGKIRLMPKEVNMGAMRNFLQTIAACRGEYVAMLEGDDYWTDPNKLERQVEFLTLHPQFSVCFHNVVLKFSRTNEDAERVFHQQLPKDIFTTEDLLAQWFIPTASVVFVNYKDFHIPDWFVHCKSGDIPYLLLLSLRGPLKYLPEPMAVYRIHDAGVSATHVGYTKIISMIFIYESFNVYTDYRFRHKVKEAEIYEIDHHYPKKEMLPPTPPKTQPLSLFKRISRKLNVMRPDL